MLKNSKSWTESLFQSDFLPHLFFPLLILPGDGSGGVWISSGVPLALLPVVAGGCPCSLLLSLAWQELSAGAGFHRAGICSPPWLVRGQILEVLSCHGL